MNKRTSYSLIVFVLITMLVSPMCKAQQDPLYSQYMFNTLPINPAYAGSREMLSALLLGRQQWVGFDGAPNTATFSIHSPLYKGMAGGTSIIYDTYGPVKNTTFNIDFAYHLKTGEHSKLSFGINGTANLYTIDYTNLTRQTAMDNAYTNAVDQEWLPNVGFGLYFYSPNYYVGVSSPRMIENSYDSDTDGDSKVVRHYYAMAGYVFHISEMFVLRPSALARASEAGPFNFDFNLYGIFYDKLWLGAMYRLDSAYGASVQYQISPQVKVGYAYDMSTNELSSYHSGSHELMISYDFNFNRTKIYNPRYF